MLRSRELPELRAALARPEAEAEPRAAAESTAEAVGNRDARALAHHYDQLFDASAGLRCPALETSVIADTPSEQMTRTYTLADVAGFYRAFGVEVGPGEGQPDHIAAELEFMHLLAVKEAVARSESGDSEHAKICREATCSFLRDHLGRWAPRFAQQLEEAPGADAFYVAADRLLGRFVALDAAGLGAR